MHTLDIQIMIQKESLIYILPSSIARKVMSPWPRDNFCEANVKTVDTLTIGSLRQFRRKCCVVSNLPTVFGSDFSPI